MNARSVSPRVAIACGGTGGHLFPGLAVAHELARRGIEVTLFVSPKEVDQQAVQAVASRFRVLTLPAIGLQGRNLPQFALAACRSYGAARRVFRSEPPQAVLAMGGFTSAPPVLAGRRTGAATFLHESNVIPGRANRWLARVVDECFVGFPAAASALCPRRITVTGTPVRAEFRPQPAAAARASLGLAPDQPVLLVMGGSQGAHGINQLVTAALPSLAVRHPGLQFIHLTGPADFEAVRQVYVKVGAPARVLPFSQHMELALAAATVAISRSGASSLAELAAMRVPALLVPYPAATDDHQRHNALVFVAVGAARLLDQTTASPADVGTAVGAFFEEPALRPAMVAALAALDAPEAAARIAGRIGSRLTLPPPCPEHPTNPFSTVPTGAVRGQALRSELA